MKILSLETSCDETAIALLEGDKKTATIKVLSQTISSQIKTHAPWGGVVPNLAAREHIKNIIPVLEETLKKSSALKPVTLSDIDLLAVTQGPGLVPALLVGINVAQTLAYFYQKPLIGVHHLEAHLFASFKDEKNNLFYFPHNNQFPLLALIISGGHTQLIYSDKPFHYKIIGQTQDDAVGEAFDKVAKILDLDYPGGPIVAQYAQNYLQEKDTLSTAEKKDFNFEFPRPMLNQTNFDFSFSGLKTAVLYKWKTLTPKLKTKSASLVKSYKQYICYAFQEAVIEVLTAKTLKAIEKLHPQTVILAGGVSANQFLKDELKRKINLFNEATQKKVDFLSPSLELCGDNATMVGLVGFFRFLKQKNHSTLMKNTLPVKANWEINHSYLK